MSEATLPAWVMEFPDDAVQAILDRRCDIYVERYTCDSEGEESPCDPCRLREANVLHAVRTADEWVFVIAALRQARKQPWWRFGKRRHWLRFARRASAAHAIPDSVKETQQP